MTVKTYTFKTMEELQKSAINLAECGNAIIESGGTGYASISDEIPRDDNDNRKFHAIMNDIWKQAVIDLSYKGKLDMSKYAFDECKALLVTWFVTELEMIEQELPKYLQLKQVADPRYGRWVSIRPSTTSFSKKWAQQFCQFLWSTGSEGGVSWSDPASKEYESMMNEGSV